jgi:hypothetical protein
MDRDPQTIRPPPELLRQTERLYEDQRESETSSPEVDDCVKELLTLSPGYHGQGGSPG